MMDLYSHSIKLNQGLIETLPDGSEPIRKKWETDLKEEIEEMCENVHNYSYNLRHTLLQFKIIHRIIHSCQNACNSPRNVTSLLEEKKAQRNPITYQSINQSIKEMYL